MAEGEGLGARTRRPAFLPATGLAFLGYGFLVLAELLAHDAKLVGLLSVALGILLLVPGLPPIELRRARVVAAAGAAMVLGVLAYNVFAESTIGAPEWGILLYGMALLVAAPFLERKILRADVATLVGWSFPVLLAPLALFALNALVSTESTGAAASPLVRSLVVLPTAAGLRLLGTPVEIDGTTLMLATPRGSLSLGVGLVCAGLYPVVLFAGLAGLHTWQHPADRPRMAAYVLVGLLGLWALNLVRLVALAKIGQAWGASALQEAHANLGWILFAAYMALFWWLVFRRAPTPVRPAPAA